MPRKRDLLLIAGPHLTGLGLAIAGVQHVSVLFALIFLLASSISIFIGVSRL